MTLSEAATIKARAKGLLRAVAELLSEKTLPGSLRRQLEGISAALRKKWTDLEADAADDPPAEKREADVEEAAILGNYLEARLHSLWTSLADDLYGAGYLNRAERIALAGAIGAALETFTAAVQETAPQIYERGPWDGAPAEPDPNGAGDMDANEAAELETECIPLIERAVRSDGTIPVKIIAPGWGSSGYYPAEVLERDGPKVFTRGLKMYWDHPTLSEEAERPERSLRDLSAELVSDARWEAAHPAGPGLYADAKVFETFRPAIDELAPHIGVSIRARGRAVQGEAEGRSGPIIQEISAARSVDFVTQAGAGGKILQLFEARRGAAQEPAHDEGKENHMSEQALTALEEANAQLRDQIAEQAAAMQRLLERAVLSEARDLVREALGKTSLPEISRTRLHAALTANLPVKDDGALDREALAQRITEAVKAEEAYLAEVAGAGQIRGMGSGGSQGGSTRPNLEESSKRIADALASIGFGGNHG